MCMIVYRPLHAKSGRGANIPGAVIDTALRRHPDGFGVAYRRDGELVSEKFGPTEAKRFRKALKRVDRENATEYVAHFRFATHGAKDAAHAHPYEYIHPTDGRVLVFHNGVIDIATKGEQSDTEMFTKLVLAELPSRWWESPALMYLVTEAIGWSKLVIMTREGTYNLHSKRGDWDGGLWYSSSHKPTANTYKAPTNTSQYGHWDTTQKKWISYGSQQPAANPAARNTVRDVIVAAPAGSASMTGRIVDASTFMHGGHIVNALVDIDRTRDGDYTDGVICQICMTQGDVYVIDGGIYIDMSHMGQDDPNEEEMCDA